jgi:hypothetical protein
MSANNIRAFLESANDVVIEHVHALILGLVLNHCVTLSLATNVTLNKVI